MPSKFGKNKLDPGKWYIVKTNVIPMFCNGLPYHFVLYFTKIEQIFKKNTEILVISHSENVIMTKNNICVLIILVILHIYNVDM